MKKTIIYNNELKDNSLIDSHYRNGILSRKVYNSSLRHDKLICEYYDIDGFIYLIRFNGELREDNLKYEEYDIYQNIYMKRYNSDLRHDALDYIKYDEYENIVKKHYISELRKDKLEYEYFYENGKIKQRSTYISNELGVITYFMDQTIAKYTVNNKIYYMVSNNIDYKPLPKVINDLIFTFKGEI